MDEWFFTTINTSTDKASVLLSCIGYILYIPDVTTKVKMFSLAHNYYVCLAIRFHKHLRLWGCASVTRKKHTKTRHVSCCCCSAKHLGVMRDYASTIPLTAPVSLGRMGTSSPVVGGRVYVYVCYTSSSVKIPLKNERKNPEETWKSGEIMRLLWIETGEDRCKGDIWTGWE